MARRPCSTCFWRSSRSGASASLCGDCEPLLGGGRQERLARLKDGLIPNKGSVASQAKYFQENFSQVLTSPHKTFDWKIGDTQAKGFARRVDGKMVVLFVAKEGPYQGMVLSSMVPGARNMTKWDLW